MASPFHIIKFDSLPSTNRYLREHYRSLSHNTVVVARHQSAGRGRFDRQWVDDGGNSLLVSMLLKEDEFNYPIPWSRLPPLWQLRNRWIKRLPLKLNGPMMS
jgi:biotin-(acetyl-CoA carboxylase) ligase